MEPTPTPTPEPTPAPEPTPTPSPEPTPPEPPEKSFTQKDLDDAVAAAKKDWEKEKDEAARLAKMSAEERKAAEFDKRQKAFDEEKAKYNAERLEFECTKLLAADNLPVEFSSMLTGKDAETTKANIETFKAAFGKAIEAAVTERLKGKTPKVPGSTHTEKDPFLSGFGM